MLSRLARHWRAAAGTRSLNLCRAVPMVDVPRGASPRPRSPGPVMSDRLNQDQPAPAIDERRADLRVPASTLGDVRSRLVGGSDLTLINYTSRSLCGQASSRLLLGSRVSVRVVTATLNAALAGRVVRANLAQIVNGVPRYEVAIALDRDVEWSGSPAADSDAVASVAPVDHGMPALPLAS